MKSTVHIHNGFIYEWAEEKLHYFLAGRLFWKVLYETPIILIM
jgi:hypothetical protein